MEQRNNFPYFSVISVFNNKSSLNSNLLNSLEELGDVSYEVVLLDNTEGKFKSASSALNFGGRKAKGKFFLFIHQDVQLMEPLSKLKNNLINLENLGAVGVIGMSTEGASYMERLKGYTNDRGKLIGKPLLKPISVQTVDEFLLIVERSVFSRLKFDEVIFDGWHSYVSDYCLSVQTGTNPLKTYVVPFLVLHNSKSKNRKGFVKQQLRLVLKYRKRFKVLYQTYDTMQTRLPQIFVWTIFHSFYFIIPRRLKKMLSKVELY